MSGPTTTSPASAWAARVPLALAASAAALRAHPGVRAHASADGGLWLAGDATSAALEADLARLAPTDRYRVTGDGLLVPAGQTLPVGRLPAGEWVGIAGLLAVTAPGSALAGEVPAPVGLRLARGGPERPANVLVAPLTEFARWADGAPAVRLHRLRFAADADHALVWGEPLPPVAGRRSYESAGVAVPAGYALRPAVDATSLRARLGLAAGELALFAVDGTWERVPADAFVQARRSAVRLTAAAARAGDHGPAGGV